MPVWHVTFTFLAAEVNIANVDKQKIMSTCGAERVLTVRITPTYGLS